MALKARLKKLEKLAEWLHWDGRILKIELQLKILEIEGQIARHQAAQMAKRRAAHRGAAPVQPTASTASPPHPEELRGAQRLEGWETARPELTLRDASLRDAPQGEVPLAPPPASTQPHPEEPHEVRRLEGWETEEVPAAPPAPPEDPYAPHVGTVRWRIRGPTDDWADDDDR